MAIIKAPFETFPAYDERINSDEPYNGTYIDKCREKAIEYAQEDVFLKHACLCALKMAVPIHFRKRVFDGISFIDGSW